MESLTSNNWAFYNKEDNHIDNCFILVEDNFEETKML